MVTIQYKELDLNEIKEALFEKFNRYLDVKKFWCKEYNANLVEHEPYDCQLEYNLFK